MTAVLPEHDSRVFCLSVSELGENISSTRIVTITDDTGHVHAEKNITMPGPLFLLASIRGTGGSATILDGPYDTCEASGLREHHLKQTERVSDEEASLEEPPPDYTEGVRALTEMGFDETTASTALAATRGDIQAAIDSLFG